jgi:hypothetical protein
MNLMAGHWCLIIHWLNPKARVDIKNVKLKEIKAAFKLSRCRIHALVFEVGGDYRLTYCNYCHLQSDFSSKFQPSMTIFHHNLLKSEGMVLANGRTHPSYMTIFVNFFIKVSSKKLP